MADRIDAPADICDDMTPDQQRLIRDILARVVDKWSLWALTELTADGPLRFSRLLERVEGISQKSLTATLRQLERDGFVTRTVVVRSPIRVDYAATELGHALIRRFQPLWLWAAGRLPDFVAARAAFDARTEADR
ncbi:winged helix-turn-helix transcriptional regulator [Pleomorphomonas koreensis]|uniref:winged helix-turn-helix transcriptional regulator n=1 Tax=Pleomorphomonas koreensis TaxID=257440 RepID=UPI0003F4B31C|nr:helix-turn-helix domain-containing protein [Pleomorphomonas koreensis]